MKYNIEELLNKLPYSWADVSLETYQKLLDVEIDVSGDQFQGVNNTIATLSVFLGLDKDFIESEIKYLDLIRLSNKISFITTEPISKKKSIIKWKSVEEISYNDFIFYLQDPEHLLKNLHIFIKNFSLNQLTEEEILKLPITEIYTGFFLFRKKLIKYLNRSIQLTRLQIVKFHLKHRYQTLKEKMKL